MFDISIWEIGLILVIALIVIGPKRLPEVAHFIGRWLQRIKLRWHGVKRDIDQELQIAQLKENLRRAQQAEQHKDDEPSEKQT